MYGQCNHQNTPSGPYTHCFDLSPLSLSTLLPTTWLKLTWLHCGSACSCNWKQEVAQVPGSVIWRLFFSVSVWHVIVGSLKLSWRHFKESLFLFQKPFKCGQRWDADIFFSLPRSQWFSFSHKLSFRKTKQRTIIILLLHHFMDHFRTLPKANRDYEIPFRLKIFFPFFFPFINWLLPI